MYTRICPECGKTLEHTSRGNCATAEKTRRPCRSCAAKASMAESGNPMHGRSLHDVWREKYGEAEADRRLEAYGAKRRGKKLKLSPDGAERRIHRGSDNPRFGKSLHDVWREKYGEAEADRRMAAVAERMSARMSGEKNPMYGKPAPHGSGGGCDGWYNGRHFRSLLELGAMVKFDADGIEWQSGECLEHSIEYWSGGKRRTYFPDFFLPATGTIVEVKPSRLVNLRQNIDKFAAAAEKFGVSFVIMTEKDIGAVDLAKLIRDGAVEMAARYKKKISERHENGTANGASKDDHGKIVRRRRGDRRNGVRG